MNSTRFPQGHGLDDLDDEEFAREWAEGRDAVAQAFADRWAAEPTHDEGRDSGAAVAPFAQQWTGEHRSEGTDRADSNVFAPQWAAADTQTESAADDSGDSGRSEALGTAEASPEASEDPSQAERFAYFEQVEYGEVTDEPDAAPSWSEDSIGDGAPAADDVPPALSTSEPDAEAWTRPETTDLHEPGEVTAQIAAINADPEMPTIIDARNLPPETTTGVDRGSGPAAATAGLTGSAAAGFAAAGSLLGWSPDEAAEEPAAEPVAEPVADAEDARPPEAYEGEPPAAGQEEAERYAAEHGEVPSFAAEHLAPQPAADTAEVPYDANTGMWSTATLTGAAAAGLSSAGAWLGWGDDDPIRSIDSADEDDQDDEEEAVASDRAVPLTGAAAAGFAAAGAWLDHGHDTETTDAESTQDLPEEPRPDAAAEGYQETEADTEAWAVSTEAAAHDQVADESVSDDHDEAADSDDSSRTGETGETGEAVATDEAAESDETAEATETGSDVDPDLQPYERPDVTLATDDDPQPPAEADAGDTLTGADDTSEVTPPSDEVSHDAVEQERGEEEGGHERPSWFDKALRRIEELIDDDGGQHDR